MNADARFPILKLSPAMSRLIAAAILALTVPACAPDTSNQTAASSTAAGATSSSASGPIPAAVSDVGNYGEDIYDYAKVEGWTKAKSYLDSLHIAGTNLRGNDPIKRQRNALDSAITALDESVAARNRTATLEAANRVTYVAAQMATPYHSATPIALVLLDYYGRELEIQAAQKNLPKLKQTAAALERTWTAVRPTVEQSGGTTAARRFEALVVRMKAVQSPAGYARIATPILYQVDELEKVFKTQ